MTIPKKLCLILALILLLPIASAKSNPINYSDLLQDIKSQKPSFDPVLSDLYNVEWTSQSKDSSQSMPVGGGDIGLNVWVENNSLYFYISKSDTLDENNVFGKMGRIKIDLNPNPFAEGTSFSQKLVLKDGYCKIKGAGKDGNKVEIRVWVDVFKPVIHVDINSEKAIGAKAEYHIWRFEDIKIPMLGGFRESNDYGAYARHPVFSQPYTLYADKTAAKNNQIIFYHKNNNEDLTMNKAIDALKMRDTIDLKAWHDPATDFTFGGIMVGNGMSADKDVTKGVYMHRDYQAHTLTSKAPAKSRRITIALNTGQYKTAAAWEKATLKTLKNVKAKKDLAKTIAWWHKIWNRSFIMIDTDKPNTAAFNIGRNYQLFRYMLSCNAFGVHPSKFNGGMFTWDTVMDINGKPFGSPDYRQWGPGLTLQNQRHMYWPMLRSGDTEMQAPMFNYFADTYKNTEQFVKRAYGHDGAMYSEYYNFYGLPSMGNEYWTDPRIRPDGTPCELGAMGASLVRFEHVHQLDFSFMMLEQQRYFGTDISKYIPFIQSSLDFYLKHYKYRYKLYTREYEGSGKEDADGLDENGHLVIYPSTAAETYKNMLNPSDVIVALECVLEGLIRLHDEDPAKYKSIDVAKWKKMLKMIPPMKVGDNINGDPIFLPGYDPGEMGEKSPYYKSGSHTSPYNIENPQLSIVFPFNKVSQGRKGQQRAINTTETELYAFNGGMKSHMSWSYYNLIVTRLGMVRDAEMYANLKLGNGQYRFPSFWGPGHDFSPDHNWGGSGIYGLQEMALQSYGNVITPFATWPEKWNGSFKLYAPEETTVEGYQLKDGRKIAIMTLAKDSKRKSIALQGEDAISMIVLSADGPVETKYDATTGTTSFKVEPGKSYYTIGPKKADQGSAEFKCGSDTSITLEWKKQASALSYDIYRASASDDEALPILAKDLKTCSYTDEKADKKDGPYTYYIVASDEKGLTTISKIEVVEPVEKNEADASKANRNLYIRGMKNGKISDDSGSQTPIAIIGDVRSAKGLFGPKDTAISFQGGNGNFISLPGFSQPLTQTSLEFWLKPSFINAGECIFDARYSHSNNGFVGFAIDTFHREFVRATGGDRDNFFDILTDRTALPKDRWSYFKIVINTKEGKITTYLNGVSKFERDIKAGDSIKVGPGKITIGGGRYPGDFNYKGLLDEIKMKHYSKGIPSPKSASLRVKGNAYRVVVKLSDGSKIDMGPIAVIKDQNGEVKTTTQDGKITLNVNENTLEAEVWYDGVQLKTEPIKI